MFMTSLDWKICYRPLQQESKIKVKKREHALLSPAFILLKSSQQKKSAKALTAHKPNKNQKRHFWQNFFIKLFGSRCLFLTRHRDFFTGSRPPFFSGLGIM